MGNFQSLTGNVIHRAGSRRRHTLLAGTALCAVAFGAFVAGSAISTSAMAQAAGGLGGSGVYSNGGAGGAANQAGSSSKSGTGGSAGISPGGTGGNGGADVTGNGGGGGGADGNQTSLFSGGAGGAGGTFNGSITNTIGGGGGGGGGVGLNAAAPVVASGPGVISGGLGGVGGSGAAISGESAGGGGGGGGGAGIFVSASDFSLNVTSYIVTGGAGGAGGAGAGASGVGGAGGSGGAGVDLNGYGGSLILSGGAVIGGIGGNGGVGSGTGSSGTTGASANGIQDTGFSNALSLTVDNGETVTGATGILLSSAVGSGSIDITGANGAITGTSANGMSLSTNTGTLTVALAGTGGIYGHSAGIYATSTGNDVSVSTGNQTVTGTSSYGINAQTVAGQSVAVTTGSGLVSGTNAAGINATGGDVTVSVGTGGSKGTVGVSATGLDGGNVTVKGTNGLITGTAGPGILANQSPGGSGNSQVSVNLSGTGGISGSAIGVDAEAFGSNSTSVNVGDNAVSGGTGQGILATSGTGNVGVTTGGGLVQGTMGIDAHTGGSGSVTVATGAGDVKASSSDGIQAYSSTGDVSVTTGSGLVQGFLHGIVASTGGTGSVTVVTGAGGVKGTSSDGILASSSTGDVSVTTGSGLVQGFLHGIVASTGGSGTVTVTANGDVTGQNENGIQTSAVDGLNNVVVNSGTILSQYNGINASSTGIGGVTVDMTGGQIGTASNRANNGIVATSSGSAGNVNVTSQAIYAYTHGVDATITNSSSGGTIGVTANGNIDLAGGGTVGINAVHSGVGAAGSDMINVQNNGTINAPSSGTYGIIADATNSGALGNVTVDNSSTGNIQVAAGNDGIQAIHSGLGAVTVTNEGTIAAGQNGINARITNSANTNAVTVTSTGDVSASSGTGIYATNINGLVQVNVNGGTVQGAGGPGVLAQTTGEGDVNVNTAAGSLTGSTFNDGIYATVAGTLASVNVVSVGNIGLGAPGGGLPTGATGANGIDATSTNRFGTGSVNVSTGAAGGDTYIWAQANGINASTAGLGAVTVTLDPTHILANAGNGVNIVNSNAGNNSTITVNSTGADTIGAPTRNGIYITSNSGSNYGVGSQLITVTTGSGSIIGGTGSTAPFFAGQTDAPVGKDGIQIQKNALFGNAGDIQVQTGANSGIAANQNGIYTVTNVGVTNSGNIGITTGGGSQISAGGSGIVAQIAAGTSGNGFEFLPGAIIGTNTGAIQVQTGTNSGIVAATDDGINAVIGASQLNKGDIGITTGQGSSISAADNGINAQIIAPTLLNTGNINVTTGADSTINAGRIGINIVDNALVSYGSLSADIGQGTTITAGATGINVQENSIANNQAVVINTGNITVHANTTDQGGSGINAQTAGTGGIIVNSGSVSVSNPGKITVDGGTLVSAGNGINAVTTGASGGVQVNNFLAIDPPVDGIHAEINNAANTSPVAVTNNADISATRTGIFAGTNGLGSVSVVDGNLTGGTTVSGDANGIYAVATNALNAAAVSVSVNGNVNGYGAPLSTLSAPDYSTGYPSITGVGVLAGTEGTGSVTVHADGVGAITGNGMGIFAGANNFGSSGDILVTSSEAITVGNGTVTLPGVAGTFNAGIFAGTNGSGAVTVSTASGGTINALHGVGIDAEIGNPAGSGAINVSSNAGIQAGGDGIFAGTLGTGDVTVTTASGGAINSANATGIDALIANASSAGAIKVSTDAAITANSSGDGILAQNAGTGGVTVTTSTNGSVSSGLTGIYAVNTNSGSDGAINVTANAGVSSAKANGIYAATAGTGDVTVTNTATAPISAGDNGIEALISNASSAGVIKVSTDAMITARGEGIRAATVGTGGVTVTTSSTGIIIAGGTGIDAEINGTGTTGNVLVTADGNVTSTAGDGIHAFNAGSGNVTVTGAGNIIGDAGIWAHGTGGGNVTVTPGGTVQGATGIDALASGGAGNGTVTVTTVQSVTGTAGTGILTSAQNGLTDITLGAAVSGTVDGVNATSNAGDINITGSAAASVNGGANGISASSTGGGNITIGGDTATTGLGNVTGGTGLGIDAVTTGGNGSVMVIPLGTVSGATGINASAVGSGLVTVGLSNTVTGTAGDGVDASTFGGDINITGSAAAGVSGTVNGIVANSTGGGNITIGGNTGATGLGNVTGGTGFGIDAVTTGGNGSVMVTPLGTVSGVTGINASAVGSGLVTVGLSNTVTGTAGDGVDASTFGGDINITGSAAAGVSGTVNGIVANSTGGGNITIGGNTANTGLGNVSGGTGYGINATTSGGNGNVTVTPLGTVSGTTGINASAVGTGTVTVDVSNNVTGTRGDGVNTATVDGANTVNVTAGIIQATSNGINAFSSGKGDVTVNMTGGQIGASASPAAYYGISATSNGTGNIVVNSMPIYANRTGVYAGITNSSSEGSIGVTVNGAINAALTDTHGAGVYAYNGGVGASGTDMINVTSNANITALGSYAYGVLGVVTNSSALGNITLVNSTGVRIDAHNNGWDAMAAIQNGVGAVTVTNNGSLWGTQDGIYVLSMNAAGTNVVTVNNSGNIDVSGGRTQEGSLRYGAGIAVANAGTGGIVINDTGVIGGGFDGANVRAAGGGILAVDTGTAGGITIGAGQITSVLDGINAEITNASNADAIQVTANGAIDSSTGMGVLAQTVGTGNVTVTTNAMINAAGNGIDAEINNPGTTGAVFVTADANVTSGSGDGIHALNEGTGDVTVTGSGNIVGDAGIWAHDTGGGNVTVTPGGTVTGSTGIDALASGGAGNGTVTVTTVQNVTGTAGPGIMTSADNGATTISNNAGVVTGTTYGVEATSTGTGPITINNAAGAAIEGNAMSGAIFVDSAGGSTINNAGLIADNATQSPASLAISSGASGSVIVNNAGGAVIDGGVSFAGSNNMVNNDAGGTWNVTNPAEGVAANFGGGTNTINNAGRILANYDGSSNGYLTTFDNIQNINNASGGTIVAGSTPAMSKTTFDAAGQTQTVNNAGLIMVNGTASFTGGADSAFNNDGRVSMIQGTTGDRVYVSGNYNGGSGSVLGVDAFLGAPGSTADRLAVGGNVSGLTSILVNDVNGGPGAYNPNGIAVVGINGSGGAGNFTLNPSSSHYSSAFGGVLNKGLFYYYLGQNPNASGCDTMIGDPTAAASCVTLASAPNQVARTLPSIVRGAVDIWNQSALLWEDRQTELRSLVFGGPNAEMAAKASGKMGTVDPGPVLPKVSTWMKGLGSWGSYTDHQTLNANGQTFGYNLNYSQDTYGFIGGIDFAKQGLISPTDTGIAGLMGGYLSSRLNFNDGGTTYDYTGGTVGGSLTYMNHGYFVDGLVKADFLNISLGMPGIGYNPGHLNATTVGGIGNIGYHFNFHTNMFVEPMLTLAYASVNVDNLNMAPLGAKVGFGDGQSFRGAIGARVGGTWMDLGKRVLQASLTGRVWNEFAGNHDTATLYNPGLPITLNNNFSGAFGEVKGGVDLISMGPGLGAFANVGAQFQSNFTVVTGKIGVSYTW